MKKTLLGLVAVLVLGVPTAKAIDFCCEAGSEALCCENLGKKYCASEKACRTKCIEELCPEGYVYNNQTLKCEREVECTEGQETCGNSCCDVDSWCADVATRLCCKDTEPVYSKDGVPTCCSTSCLGNWKLDAKICDCTICELECKGNKVLNEETCECDCPIKSCDDEDYTVDVELCECVKAGEPCASNGDCTDREYCNNGFCKACHGSAPYFMEGYGCSECKTNSDCTGGKTCIEYACTLSNALCYAWQYMSEELNTCVGCSENANCDGTNVVCYDGYIRNENDGFVYCCKPNQYFSGIYCVDCPANATCDGSEAVTCNGSYKADGSVEKADFACLACEVGQYYLGTSCVNCLDNGSCDGTYATCKPGYVGHNLEATNGACCDKTSQYYDGNECKACPEHATCDGSNIKPMQGYVLDGNNVVACATDGSVCSGCPVTAKYWNGSACVICTVDSNCAETETCVNNQCKHKEAQCDVGWFWHEEWGECYECRQDWYPNSSCNGQEFSCAEGYEPYFTGCGEWGCCNKATQYLSTDGCMGYCETCPEGMVCDGTENRECKNGYVKNEYYDWVSCCRPDQYWTDCYYKCYDCPAGATCDGKNIVCGETLPYRAGGSCEGYRCVKCTENGHCPAGKTCSNNSCVDCKTDGSGTCPTCGGDTPYWNGEECVRCVIDSNCNLNGTCTDNVCTNQTRCEPNYYWNDYEEYCNNCSWYVNQGRATCYRDEITCSDGYQRNVAEYGYVNCCNKTTEMYYEWDGGGCTTCPTNAVCNGSTDITCLDGYIKVGDDGDYYSYPKCCHKTTQYYADWYGECRDCPANATCDGNNVTCNEGFSPTGNKEEGNYACFACTPGSQYRLNGQCYDCPANASCTGETATCNGSYTTHNAGTSSMVCCRNSNQYYNNGTCADCPTGATCDGTNIKPNAGYYLAEGNVPTACATDGTKCAGCSSQTPYWNGSACVGCIEGVGCADGYTCTEDFKCMINDAVCESVDQFWHEYDQRCYRCDGKDYDSCCDSLGWNDGAYRSVCDGTNFMCQDGYVPNHGEYGYYSCCRKDQYYDGEGNYSEPGCRTCPENAACDGTEKLECKDGYIENEYDGSLFCCAPNQYFSPCEWSCMDCPEGGTCDGKTVTCTSSELPYKREECQHRCVECTEHGHCPEGSRCENYTCVPCNTTGSSMCDTCTDSNARYWNGESCVRCIKDGNCDLNGSCSEYACVNQTNCNPGQFYYDGYCGGCPSNATCYRDVATCNDGFAQHEREYDGYVYCCNKKTQYWDVNDCWSGESCYTCPENAICDGSDFICKNGYVKITPEDECMGNPVCCRMDQYFSSYYGECRDCPLNATCVNGKVTCDEGFTFEEYDGGYCYTESADKCKYGQYYRYNRCYSCYDDTVAIEGLTAEQCANCPNRSYDGKYCYKEPPECGEGNYYTFYSGGRCTTCTDYSNQQALKSECESCPTMFSLTNGICGLCTWSGSNYGPVTIESCNRCPQRYFRESDSYCPMCPTGAVKDATGKGCVCPTGQTWNATSYTCDTAS